MLLSNSDLLCRCLICRRCFHQDRSLEEDLLAMICADALAVSQSTLAPLVAHHSFASRIYFPAACHESPSRDYPVACNEKLIRESARSGIQVRLNLACSFGARGLRHVSVLLRVGLLLPPKSWPHLFYIPGFDVP